MNLQTLKPFIDWLHLHPQWGSLIAFSFAFAESIAFIGLFVPGSVIMAAIGVLIGADVIPALTTISWAVAGAFLGDVLSYFIGYHYRDHLGEIWPFRLMPKWLHRGEIYFQRNGGKSIFIGRFIGPIRPILPLVAGMLKMSLPRFLSVDFIAAALWAPVYMLPGILLGAASLALAPEATKRIIIYTISFLLILWLTFWLIKDLTIRFIRLIDRSMLRAWRYFLEKERFAPFCKFLQINQDNDDHKQLVRFIFFVLCLVAFIALTAMVCLHPGILPINEAFYHFFRSIYVPVVAKVMLVISFIGSPKGFAILWLVMFAYLLWRRYWYAAGHWLSVGFLTIGLAGVLKRAITSPRPPGLVHTPFSWSYPSGHATLAAAFLGFLGVLLCQGRSRLFSRVCVSVIAIFVALITFSRLYLNLHWITDIFGALLLGTAITLGVSLFYLRKPPMKLPCGQLILVTVITLAINAAILMATNFSAAFSSFQPIWPTKKISYESWWRSGVDGQPLVRNNRFGKPVETLNIEWLGTLPQIHDALVQQGWQAKPKTLLINTIQYLGSSDRHLLVPVFNSIYEDRKPVLVIFKYVGHPKKLVILRLWFSDYYLRESNIPIYVGVIKFRHKHKRHSLLHFKKSKNEGNQPETLALDILKIDLEAFYYKELNFTGYKRLNSRDDLDWDGRILLIQTQLPTTTHFGN